jgi:hypothetical protein
MVSAMKKYAIYIHPFLVALYPIAALRNHNIEYVNVYSIVRSLILALFVTGLLIVLSKPILRDWGKAGIFATVLAALFFSYGQVYLFSASIFGEPVRHRVLLGAYALLAAGILIALSRMQRAKNIQAFLTIFGAALLAPVWIQSGIYDINVLRASISTQQANRTAQNTAVDSTVSRPDIYLIILDGHTRTDVLKDIFDYDNTGFINGLEDLGFYVARCSQSNYPTTKFSLTSLMNAGYLQDMFGGAEIYPAFSASTIVRALREHQYQVYAFENRASGHFDLGEDVHLTRNPLDMGNIQLLGGVNEFEAMLWETTVLRIFIDMPQLLPGFSASHFDKFQHYEHYEQTKFILNELKELPSAGNAPKFVFAHIMVPHNPYIFTPGGEFQWMDDEKIGYASNAEFIDRQILDVARAIIENSNTPPVIILQGDHGPTSFISKRTRLKILNAYYVSDAAKKDLYPQITPVNTFRVILNRYFNAEMSLLEDASYFGYKPNEFTSQYLVPNTCK